MRHVKNAWSVGVVGLGILYLINVVELVMVTVTKGWGWFFIAFFSLNIATLLATIVLSWINATKPSKGKAGGALLCSLISTLSVIFVPRSGMVMLVIVGLATIALIRNPKTDLFLPIK
jgi:hypothetical protein